MKQGRSAKWLGLAAVLIASCSSGADDGVAPTGPAPTDVAPAADDKTTTTTTTSSASASSSTAPSTTPAAEAEIETETETEVPVTPSITFPEIATVDVQRLADQSERATLGGADTFYWPDGNIGTLELIGGTTRFFAANSGRIAQTEGSPLDPTAELLVADQEIAGVSDEFDYVAGGPVYLDQASGTLLLWYHAERHMNGNAGNFHAAIGLARSDDLGATFNDLGIIIETNSAPDPSAPCCADVGGAPVIVRDGMFHLWFRDRVGATNLIDIQLARASAPVDAVIEAALRGELADWTKYDDGDATPGLGGTSSALEAGNPKTSWFDVAWHDTMQRYVMVIASHGLLAEPSTLFMTTSSDGLTWTPRQVLVECDCELTYPSFLATVGPERIVGNRLDIVYVATVPTADYRWQDTSVEHAVVELSGDLVTSPTTWTFDDLAPDTGGWLAGGDATTSMGTDGLAVIADGSDPFITRPGLGLSAAGFDTMRITMTSESAGIGQVFFTTDSRPRIAEQRSVRFDVEAPGEPMVYDIHLGDLAGWSGLIDTLRIDPIDQQGAVRIESIMLVGTES